MLPFALLAACALRYGDLPPLAPSSLPSPLPAEQVELVLPQGRISVQTIDTATGNGPPLVFVHGLSSNMAYWHHQLDYFAQSRRVMALDLPGYGASDRPDAPYTPPWYASVLTAWLDEEGIDQAIIVGHSMGGQVALTFALQNPDRVAGLVLSAPAGFETFAPGSAAFMKKYWHETRALNTTEDELRTTFQTLVFNRWDEHTEQLLAERVAMGKHPEFAGTSVAVSRSIAGMLDHPVYEHLGQIDVPTLIVFGDRDRMIPNPIFTGGRSRAVAEIGLNALPKAELVMVPRAGHTVHHDAPDAFNQAVTSFLEELNP